MSHAILPLGALVTGLLLGSSFIQQASSDQAQPKRPLPASRIVNLDGWASGNKKDRPATIYKVPANKRLVVTDIAIYERNVQLVQRLAGKDTVKRSWWLTSTKDYYRLSSLKTGLVFEPGSLVMLALRPDIAKKRVIASGYHLNGYLTDN